MISECVNSWRVMNLNLLANMRPVGCESGALRLGPYGLTVSGNSQSGARRFDGAGVPADPRKMQKSNTNKMES